METTNKETEMTDTEMREALARIDAGIASRMEMLRKELTPEGVETLRGAIVGAQEEETKRATYNDRSTAAFRAILTAIAAATDASVYGTVHTPGTYPGKHYDGAIMYVVGTEMKGMLRAVYTPSVRAVAEAYGCYVESVNCEVGAVFMADAE